MKKNIFFLFLLPLLLTACGPKDDSSSSSDSSTQESTSSASQESSSSPSSAVLPELKDILPLFQNGYKMNAKAEETTGGKTTTTTAETESQNEKITFRSTDESEKTLFFETYYQKKDDQLESTRLDISNTLSFYPLYNPVTYEYYRFEQDGFRNFFTALTIDDFRKEGTKYLLETEKATLENAIVTQLYGNPGFDLRSLAFEVEGTKTIAFEADFSFQASYTYHYEGTFVALEEGETILERAVPYPEVSDATFEEAIEKLTAGNYTLVQKDYEGEELLSTSNYKINEKGVSYQTNGYDMYYYVTDDGRIQICEKLDGFYVRQGEPEEGSLKELMPSFRLSAATMDKEEDVYTMKEDVEGDLMTMTIFEAVASELADFTITITDDQILATNVSGESKTELTFTDLGTTDHGISESDIKDPSTSADFIDLLEEESADNLLALMGEEANTLPAPTNYTQPYWVDFTEDPSLFLFFLYYDEVTVPTQEDLLAYGEVLEGLGYQSFEGSLNGGLAYTKELDNGITLYVEILDYDGIFTLIFMDMANYELMM